MFPTELVVQNHMREMLREAEKQRLLNAIRTQPTLWQRLRARLSARRVASSPLPTGHPHDVIATSR